MTKKIEKIDYAAEFAKTAKMLEGDKLNAIVLAPSGGGKSSLAGTFGVKTLYLYGSSEAHGPRNAMAYSNCEVLPICIDAGRDPDQVLEFLSNILQDSEFLKDFEAVVIDSVNALEVIIKESNKFKLSCLTDKGKINSFVESDRLLSIFNDILKDLRNTGKHTLMTCVLDAQQIDSETGEILESTPRISTYKVAEHIIMQFGDVFTVGKLTIGEKEGYRIQFGGKISKTSKDAAGRIKKLINFNPRLAGYGKELPDHIPANLSKLLMLKQGKSE